MSTYPAQIIFTEVDRIDAPRRWIGRLLRPSASLDVGGYKGRPRAVTWTPRFDITEDPETGPTTHSRQYASYGNVTAAQTAGIRWAGRRFRVPAISPSEGDA